MRTLKAVALPLVAVLLATALAGVSVAAGRRVSNTARSLELSNISRLTDTMTSFIVSALTANQGNLAQLEAKPAAWHGDARDNGELARLMVSLPKVDALALLDSRTGRVVAAAGSTDLLPRAGAPALRPLLAEATAGRLGVADLLRGRAGQPVFAEGVWSPAYPHLVFTAFLPAQDAGVDQYLNRFGAGARGSFVLVDTRNAVVWASDLSAVGRPFARALSARSLAAGRRAGRRSVDGRQLVVAASPLGTYGWTTVFEGRPSVFFAGISGTDPDSTYLMVGLLVLLAVVVAGATYRRQRELARASSRLQTLLADVDAAVLVLDGDSRVSYASPGAFRVLDADPGTIVGSGIDAAVGPAGSAVLAELVRANRGHRRALKVGDIPCKTPTGRPLWLEATVADRRRAPGVNGTVVSLHDVTDRRERTEQLLHDTLHDGLTGLANRARFAQAVEASLQRCRATGGSIAVLYLDLDGFKPINDLLGHQAGDLVLQKSARRLAAVLRPGDVAGRLGGDEFAVVLEPADLAVAEQVALRILDAMHLPVLVGDRQLTIGVSIGIALSQGPDDSRDALLRDADLAMYQAKEAGRNRFSTFDRERARGLSLPAQRPPR